MKLPQFSLRALMLTVTCIAVACFGWLGWMNTPGAGFGTHHIEMPIKYICWDMPLWLPFAFAAYVLGRRSITIPAAIVFAVLEAFAVGLCYALLHVVPYW